MSNMQKKICAIRGAIDTKNTEQAIRNSVKELITFLYNENNLVEEDIVSIQFTVTKDLTELNPAAALRSLGFADNVPLFCSQEPDVKNGLPNMIRVMITVYLDAIPKHCYLGLAKTLRPEFAIKMK
ncbi:MAG: chorismate mutase [Treponema sp. CETP13]|nr:MAG: chorismate mutase [Treponema sp. CETP13]